MKKIIAYILCVFLISNICFAIDVDTFDVPVWSEITNGCTIQTSNNMIDLESKAGILMEAKTGRILFEQNSNEKLRPASVTKIMTILLIMESIENGKIKLDDQVPCSDNASKMGGSQIWLDQTESLSVDDMLKAICVVSANDCAVAMAEYIAGSENEFVNMMNKKAQDLGMKNTTFKNCHGIDEDGHLTTANDIALMSRELINKYPQITKYTTIWIDSLRDGKSQLVNTNKLIRSYMGITGLKTGSTSLALYNLSATATRNDLSLIAVIMGGPTSKVRFNEASRLLDIGFANYNSKQLCKSGVVAKTIEVEKGLVDKVDVIYKNDVIALLKKGEASNVITEEIITDKITAPVEKDTKVGEIIYKIGENEIGRTDIVTYYNVEKRNLFESMSIVLNYLHSIGR